MILCASSIEKVPGAMALANRLVQSIDVFTDYSGRSLAWLSLAMAATTTVIVILRYGFNTGSIAAQETVTYMHASLFMLGAAYALKAGAHVRVDIFYRDFGPRARAWVDALGGVVFLLPLCVFIVGSSWGFVAESWSIHEISPEPGGLPAVFLLKTLIPLMAVNLLLQGVADILRAVAVLRLTETGV